MSRPKLLIEQWLPIEAIGAECIREKSLGLNTFPPTHRLHVWWARRPLMVSRAAILASILPAYPTKDAPDARPWPEHFRELFPSFDSYKAWFLRLIGILGDTVAGKKLIEWARKEGRSLSVNPYGFPRAFTVSPNQEELEQLYSLLEWTWGTNEITFCDPMAGGGTIPFEALRYGLSVIANELNPVASIILKTTLEYPARFGADLANDIDKWGSILSERVSDRLAPYFPRQDDEEIFVYIWCRTIACPFTGKPVPLSPNWWLRKETKSVGGRSAHVGIAIRPIFSDKATTALFDVVEVVNKQPFDPGVGTIRGGTGISPWASNQTIDGEYIKSEAKAGRMDEQLCAVGLATQRGRRFRKILPEDLAGVKEATKRLSELSPVWEAKGILPHEQRYIGPSDRLENYGHVRFVDLFAPRQLLALGTVVEEFRKLSGEMKLAYKDDLDRFEAVTACLGLAVDKVVDYNSRLAVWDSIRYKIAHTFSRHDFRFKWSHAEYDLTVPRLGIAWVVGQVSNAYRGISALAAHTDSQGQSHLYDRAQRDSASRIQVTQGNASCLANIPDEHIALVCVDPPYYDNVIYSECADFFYVWLKRTYGTTFNKFFKEELTNKDDEAVANWARFKEFGKGKKKSLARSDYERKTTAAFKEMNRIIRKDGILVVMFTHKEVDAWETLGVALVNSGFRIDASWPVHTESEHSLHQAKKNAAASTIVLICRKRESTGEPAWWEDLKGRVRETARETAEKFESDGIRGVDLYISTFGPVLSIISERWPVLTSNIHPKTADPLPLQPGEALDLARREVINLRKRGLLLGRSVEFDPVTDWYLMAWDAFRAQEFPADEARKLALALGLDLEATLIREKRLVSKKAKNVVISLPAARRKKGMVDPEAEAFPHLIDALHTAMMIYEEDGSKACQVFIDRHGLRNDSRIKALVQAAMQAVPTTRSKEGRYNRPEMAVLEALRLSVWDDLPAPPEEVAPKIDNQMLMFGHGTDEAELSDVGDEVFDEDDEEESEED